MNATLLSLKRYTLTIIDNIQGRLFTKRFILYGLILLFSHNLFSQDNLSIVRGKVLDETNLVVSYATVAVLNVDSTFHAGSISKEDGSFEIGGIPIGKRIVLISFIGYKNKYIDVDFRQSVTSLEDIVLEKDQFMLSEVTVTATPPQFKMENGVLTTNVASTLLSTLGTANNVLEKIPGVTTIDDAINVFGKGTPVIYVNNRKLHDVKELEQIPSTEILSVELNRNPGAKYDSQNKAVIIIRTKKKEEGFSATAFERLRIGKYLGDTEILGLAYSDKKVLLSLQYAHSYFKTKVKESSEYSIHADTLWQQKINGPYRYKENGHNLTATFDWEISEKHGVGVRYINSIYTDNLYSVDSQTINADEKLYESISGNTSRKNKPTRHTINTFYTGNFTDKLAVQFDFDYVNTHTNSHQLTNEVSSRMPERLVDINGKSDFSLYAGKLLGTNKINANLSLDVGIEYNKIKGDGFYINETDKLHNNIFSNEENKLAGFVSYQARINKYSINLGLRYEYSHEKSTKGSTQTTNVDKKYNDFYPNLLISRSFDNFEMSLAANRRTRRPSFSELSNDDLYINRFTTQKGNPYLKKEDIYEVDYNLFHKYINLNIGYSYIKDPIFMAFKNMESESSITSILTYENHNRYQKINALASAYYNIGVWKPQLSLGVDQSFMTTEYMNERMNRDKLSYVLTFNNDFSLSKDFSISTYYTYRSDFQDYISEIGGYSQFDIRFQKRLFSKTLSMNLYVNDVFNWKKEKFESFVDNYNFRNNRKRETQYMTFTVQYSFNSTKKSYRGKGAASDDLNRL